MSRQNIILRLLYLRNWELINIFLLPACLYFTVVTLKIQNRGPYAFGMFIICVVLAQGVFYWHLKLQTIYKNKIALPPYFHKIFSVFRWVDVVLLSMYPILMIANNITPHIYFRVSVWSNALFLFATLEFVNYYYYQLSHDSMNDIRYLLMHKKIRRSPLYVDLQKNKERAYKQTPD